MSNNGRIVCLLVTHFKSKKGLIPAIITSWYPTKALGTYVITHIHTAVYTV